MQYILLVLLFLVAGTHLRSAFLAQMAMNKTPQMANFANSLTNADALAHLARKEYLTNGNLPDALQLYQKGLAHFVFDIPSWLGIIEIFIDQGKKKKAGEALRFVDRIAANNQDIVWTKALLAHELDMEDILAKNLVWLAAHHPGKLPQIFSLADLRWQEPETIMKLLGQPFYPKLLQYYITIRDRTKSEKVWRKIERTKTGTRDIALKYVNFLLSMDDVGQAGVIWNTYYGEKNSLLFNPDLKEPFIGSGFAWQITRTQAGFSRQHLPDPDGLQIVFDGTENISFRLQQIVPLAPGRYTFTGLFSSRNLTTDQHPYWSIRGYKCQDPNIKADMLPSTAEEGEFIIPFHVPDDCRAVIISLRRNSSYFFDNKISGTLQIKELKIEPGGAVTRKNVLPDNREKVSSAETVNSARININSITVH